MDSLEGFNQERKKEEYQMQHFEFYSSQFTNEVKEEVMAVTEEAANALERSLLEKYQSVDRDEIQLATKKLIETYSEAVGEWAPSFQERMDNHFLCIPSSALLDEDKPQEVQYSREEVERVDQEIRELERKLIGSNYMAAKLKENLKEAKEALREREKCLDAIRTAVPSLCDVVKTFDKSERKRRQCHEMDGCVFEGISEHKTSNGTITLKTKIAGKNLKVTQLNPYLCKTSHQL